MQKKKIGDLTLGGQVKLYESVCWCISVVSVVRVASVVSVVNVVSVVRVVSVLSVVSECGVSVDWVDK